MHKIETYFYVQIASFKPVLGTNCLANYLRFFAKNKTYSNSLKQISSRNSEQITQGVNFTSQRIICIGCLY